MDAVGSTVLWRLFRPATRDRTYAVLLPGGPPFTLALFANDQMDRIENYDTLELTMFRAGEIKRSLVSEDWIDD